MSTVDTSANQTPSNPPETTLWSGHTSQWVHFWFYVFSAACAVGVVLLAVSTAGAAAFGLAVPLVMVLIRWWMTRCTVYELTTQRLKVRTGILNRKFDELELFRVKDYTMEQPLFLRMVGLGSLKLLTSDLSSPEVHIKAIPQVEKVREMLRTAVQAERERKRVREMDLGEGSAEFLTA